ncbi:uncharacterized protein LOC124303525 [Neodiprion virginianus]|uniref:uncharacterized protein LOC124303525 n=1 Tax=Neodiprion virginianus TaxID=2961670 RepID=UPI001EE775D8|nr:uncharacterized protein LOC124303525 [Neodiprion virginianus]XP_046616768.1 uncharacterized protein LOC124303525 [Neodiprion virginianus]
MQHRGGESKIKHEEQILEAIDQLRRRKARPDADRICNYLLRKCSVDARDTIADLHRLIEAEKVIQVDYKGNTSYRNASKWSRLQLYKNKPEGFVKEKLNSSMVAGAVAELVVAEPDYLDQGVPADRLIEQLMNGSTSPTTRRVVDDFLSKEVASGNLTRLNNGNYSLVATPDMTQESVHQENSRQENGIKKNTSKNLAVVNAYDFTECDDMTVTDSRSNTPKSSGEASPKQDSLKKDEYCEIATGTKQTLQNSHKDNSSTKSRSRFIDNKEESLNRSNNHQPNLKKASKSERKQRLQVRSEEPVEIEINYEDYRTDRKEETEQRDESEQLSEERDEEDAGRSSTNPSPTPSSTNTGGFRSARRKRAKKVFDPSDNNLVRRKRGRQSGSQNKTAMIVSQDSQEAVKPSAKEGPHRHCSLCAKQKQERLVACRDCTVRAHPSCIYSPEELIHKLDSSWQCERCKSCTVCCETSDAGPLITCYSCDEAYHSSCHTPRISVTKSTTKWHCNNCTQKHSKTNNTHSFSSNTSRPVTPSHPSVLPPVLSPQVSPARGSSDQMDDDGPRDGIDPNIPDASDWTSEQVYQYFARLFPKEAEVFRQQDIDGHSLLLMKRSDVLSSMDLLLGPALKIYRHVLKLQIRRDDPRLYWL